MVIVFLLVVMILLWLIFHLPIERERVPDTYEFFLNLKKEGARRESREKDR